MKKISLIIVSILLITLTFISCSKSTENNTTTAKGEDTTVSTTAKNSKDKDKKDATKKIKTTSRIETKTAQIKDEDAINTIKNISANKLGLSKAEKEECSFMVSTSGVDVKGERYIKVIAAVKTESTNENGDKTYQLDERGAYFISYNGKTILKQDQKTGEYVKIRK